ncbi:META domain-containing protein [Sinomicrobium kalidii]|uniref:META domain-containing protein n=1 Tax=Sinomicrobium kalidii TaxID=2900738 RepID=UPI001E45E7FF|nr:META domain-containing protein [Sinomicrobium kalidii]UGU15991.1 META domain-containing protein [Sinomicrobium kalidii]
MKKFTLSLGAVVLMSVLIFSCNTTPKADPVTALTSNTWMLETLKGEKVDSTGYARGLPYLEFDAGEMHVSGFAGCNRVMGGFTLEEKTGISLNELASTKMACAGVKGETEFLAALGTVTGFKAGEKSLKLMTGDTEVMTFTPQKEE